MKNLNINDIDALIAEATSEFQALIQKSEPEATPSEPEVSVKTDNSYSQEEVVELEQLYASMSKSEQEAHLASIRKICGGVEVEPMTKSEDMVKAEELAKSLKSEVETVKKENEELKKSVEDLTNALGKFMSHKPAPQRKAITSIEYIAKSEGGVVSGEKEEVTLNKNEVISKLNKLDYSALTKSDRESINNYCLKNGTVDSVKHLIK